MSERIHIPHNLDEIIRKTRRMVQEVNKATTSFKKVRTAAESARNTFNKLTGASNRMKDSFGGLHGMMIRMAGILSGRALVQYGRDAIRTAADIEAMRVSMDAAAGSTVRGSRAFNLAKSTATSYGLAMLPAIEGLQKLTAATKGTVLEGAPAESLFKGISKAIAVLGLNSERSHGTYMAFEQIISKGKVSAEELRRQLGDRIPGAFQIAARAMNVTTSELDKMIRQGKLLSEDFIPKMAAQLEKEFAGGVDKASKTTRAALNNLDNTILMLKDSIGRQLFPAIKTTTTLIESFKRTFQSLLDFAEESPKQFKAWAAAIMTFAGAVTAAMFGLNPMVGVIASLIGMHTAYTASLDQTTNAMRRFRAAHDMVGDNETNIAAISEKYGKLKDGRMFTGKDANQQKKAFQQSLVQDIKAERESMKSTLKEMETTTALTRAQYQGMLARRSELSDMGSYGLLGYVGVGRSPEEKAELARLDEQLSQYSQFQQTRKKYKGRDDALARMLIGMGEDPNDPYSNNTDNAVPTGMATVNGTGNRILNVTIGNIVETLNNNFREADSDQQEAEASVQIDRFRQGLYGVLNDLDSIQG